jgi:hypothetical protein
MGLDSIAYADACLVRVEEALRSVKPSLGNQADIDCLRRGLSMAEEH